MTAPCYLRLERPRLGCHVTLLLNRASSTPIREIITETGDRDLKIVQVNCNTCVANETR